MKKFIAILLTMVFVASALMMTGCGKSSGGSAEPVEMSNSQYVGTWKVSKVMFNGEEVEMEDMFEYDIVLELNADGTCALTGEEVSKGTWTETDEGVQLKGDDLNISLTDDDGLLDMSILGAHIFMEKSEQ